MIYRRNIRAFVLLCKRNVVDARRYSGLFNIFEGDSETMMYDTAAMAADIEEYGLFTYEELNAIVPVPEAIFDAVNGQYLKVSIGKGLITYEQIGELIDLYSGLF